MLLCFCWFFLSLLVTSKRPHRPTWYTYLVGGFKIHTYFILFSIYLYIYIYCIYFQPWKWEDDSNLLTISYIYIVYSMYIHSIYTYIYIYYIYYIILVGGDWNMAFMTFHIGISSSPGRAEKNRAISPECETHGDIPWGEQKTCDLWVVYPLVNSHITMENHNFSWVNPLFLWPFSIAMLVYQMVLMLINRNK